LVERPAEHDVDQLGAAADAKQRGIIFERPADPLDFEAVPIRVSLDRSLEIPVVVLGTDVIAAANDQCIQPFPARAMPHADPFRNGAAEAKHQRRAPPPG
jgi:hypothetical protein